MIGIIFALMASLSWGAGDFCGGLVTRKINPFQVLLLTTASSVLLMILFTLLWQENLPKANDLILAVLAGISGALGLAALYRGLSLGHSALVAPVAGVIGAIIPTFVGLFIEGLPNLLVLTGYALSVVGIWLVSRVDNGSAQITRNGLGFAVLAGIGFGGFLALIAQVEGEQIFSPLIFAKLASLVLALFLVRMRSLAIIRPTESPIAILSGFLDAGGNVFYLYATQYVRLDIAALLSSLYPAATVLLSKLLLQDQLSKYQWIGVSVCIVAIMLITTG
jgi:drug/metabolite transporter (DMT)-like permease